MWKAATQSETTSPTMTTFKTVVLFGRPAALQYEISAKADSIFCSKYDNDLRTLNVTLQIIKFSP